MRSVLREVVVPTMPRPICLPRLHDDILGLLPFPAMCRSSAPRGKSVPVGEPLRRGRFTPAPAFAPCGCRGGSITVFAGRRDAGVVERGGLENRCGGDPTQGSNPCLSASHPRHPAHSAFGRPTCGNRGAFAAPSSMAARYARRILAGSDRTCRPVSSRRMQGGVAPVTGNFRCLRAKTGRPRRRRRDDVWIMCVDSDPCGRKTHFPVFPRNRGRIRHNRAGITREQGRECAEQCDAQVTPGGLMPGRFRSVGTRRTGWPARSRAAAGARPSGARVSCLAAAAR